MFIWIQLISHYRNITYYSSIVSRRWRPVKSKPGPGCLHSHCAVKFLSVMMLFGGEREGQTLSEVWRFHFGQFFNVVIFLVGCSLMTSRSRLINDFVSLWLIYNKRQIKNIRDVIFTIQVQCWAQIFLVVFKGKNLLAFLHIQRMLLWTNQAKYAITRYLLWLKIIFYFLNQFFKSISPIFLQPPNSGNG